MTAVADTSPINYLIQVEAIDVLGPLFAAVLIPREVEGELGSARAPDEVCDWIKRPPHWLHVRRVGAKQLERATEGIKAARLRAMSENLDPGEREAIALALDRYPDLLIIDDRQGRKVAKGLHLNMTGTLGVLDRADDRGMITDLPAMLRRLVKHTTFRVEEDLVELLLRRHQERKG